MKKRNDYLGRLKCTRCDLKPRNGSGPYCKDCESQILINYYVRRKYV